MENNNYEIKFGLINMIQNDKYHGLALEDPIDHLDKFDKKCGLFPFYLGDKAHTWEKTFQVIQSPLGMSTSELSSTSSSLLQEQPSLGMRYPVSSRRILKGLEKLGTDSMHMYHSVFTMASQMRAY